MKHRRREGRVGLMAGHAASIYPRRIYCKRNIWFWQRGAVKRVDAERGWSILVCFQLLAVFEGGEAGVEVGVE